MNNWGKRGNKFGNTKVQAAGMWFDSKAEAALYHRLALEERGGRIRDLKSQPGTIFLGPARTQYRPDFSFIDAETEELCHAEFKGFKTPAWRLKLKLWRSVGPTRLDIYEGSAANIKLVETVLPPKGACPTCGRIA